MKKEYHYTISRTDRICIIAFVIALLSWELVKFLIPGTKKEYAYLPQTFEKSGPKKKYEKEYPSKKPYSKKYYSPTKRYTPYGKKYISQKSPPTQPVQISKATIDELVSTGLSRKAAYNIQKYIAAGGIIDEAQDLLRIYGMDSVQLNIAIPYLIFPGKSFSTNNVHEKTSPDQKIDFIDINTASASRLDSLPGIGPILSERIVKFRESLGGYTSVNQVRDCYGITQELFDAIKPFLTISGTPAQIAINQEDLTTISHPYFPVKMKKIIQAYKDQHGVIADASALKKAYPPDTTWIERLLPYLNFE